MKHLYPRELLALADCSSAYEDAAFAHSGRISADYGASSPDTNAVSAEPVYGTWLDANLHLPTARGQALIKCVQLAVSAFEQERGYGKRYVHSQRHFETLTECIVANAIRGHFFRELPWIAYNRQTKEYWSAPVWINGSSLGKAVDRLSEFALLGGQKGKTGNASSTFKAMPKLLDWSVSFGVEPSDVKARIPTQRSLIVLRNQKKRNVRFTPTPFTKRWSSDLHRYGEFLNAHDVSLCLSTEEKRVYVDAANENRREGDLQPHLREPELFRRFPCRIFNNSSWNEGGRMYRTWWQETKSELRSKIEIEGQPTVELDYSSLLPRLIYHYEFGVDFSKQDDPYLTDDLIGYALDQGREHDHYREPAKTLLIALLNAKEGGSGQVGYKIRRCFDPEYNLEEIEQQFVQMHPQLATLFRTGIGLKMQRLDSDIAVQVLMSLMDQGILALAVHDSFLVQEQYGEQLRTAMIQAYSDRTGFEPVIKPDQ